MVAAGRPVNLQFEMAHTISSDPPVMLFACRTQIYQHHTPRFLRPTFTFNFKPRKKHILRLIQNANRATKTSPIRHLATPTGATLTRVLPTSSSSTVISAWCKAMPRPLSCMSLASAWPTDVWGYWKMKYNIKLINNENLQIWLFPTAPVRVKKI